jgi:drug/metabolite transporter (DMT)-like permease
MATTLHFLYPLLVVCWRALADRKRPGVLKLAGLVLGLAGVVCLLEPGGEVLHPTGAALALLSSVFFAAYMLILQKENHHPLPLYQLTSVISLTGVAVCGAAGAALGKITFALTPEAWGYAAACALLVSIGGSALLQAGVRRVGDANASIYSLLEPITSILFGMLLLGESFTPRKALSCGLILLGLLLTALCDRREAKEGRDVP